MILGAKSRGIGAVQCWPPRGWGSIPRSRSSTIPRPMRASQTSGGWGQTKCPWGCSTQSSSSIASTSGAWTSSRRRSDSCSAAVTQWPPWALHADAAASLLRPVTADAAEYSQWHHCHPTLRKLHSLHILFIQNIIFNPSTVSAITIYIQFKQYLFSRLPKYLK